MLNSVEPLHATTSIHLVDSQDLLQSITMHNLKEDAGKRRQSLDIFGHTTEMVKLNILTQSQNNPTVKGVVVAIHLIPTVLLIFATLAPGASAAIFTVKTGTVFYSQPTNSEKFRLNLPEVRVYVPPLQDNQGYCRFKLIYKRADRDNPQLPSHGWARCVATDEFISP